MIYNWFVNKKDGYVEEMRSIRFKDDKKYYNILTLVAPTVESLKMVIK